MITRRAAAQILASATLSAATLATIGGTALRPAHAADKTVTIGINLSLTGADAEGATRILNGALLAIDHANAAKAIPGYHLRS